MPSRITSILATQAEELERLQDAEARRVLRLVEDARRELRERMQAMVVSGEATRTPFTAQSMRVVLAQSEATAAALRIRLDETLSASAKTSAAKALRDLLQVIRAHEPDFIDAGSRIEFGVAARMSADQGLLLHKYSTSRYSAELLEAIQIQLSGAVVRGLSLDQTTTRICGTDTGVFAGKRHKAELICRMEHNRAYNDLHQASLEETAKITDEPGRPDPLGRQISEVADARNNPFSRAADGTIAKLREPFRVSVGLVREAAKAMKRPASGIVWREERGFYVGMTMPAHFNERGRQVPWRASWVD